MKMQTFWNWFVNLLPMWIAPNLITLFAFILSFLSLLPLFFYDLTLKEDVPSWIFLLNAIVLFLYQTLDAVDGWYSIFQENKPEEQIALLPSDRYSIMVVILLQEFSMQSKSHRLWKSLRSFKFCILWMFSFCFFAVISMKITPESWTLK